MEVFLQSFLVEDTKALLLVHHDEAEVLEGHVFAEQAVSSNHDINAAVTESQQGLLLLFLGTEAAE